MNTETVRFTVEVVMSHNEAENLPEGSLNAFKRKLATYVHKNFPCKAICEVTEVPSMQ